MVAMLFSSRLRTSLLKGLLSCAALVGALVLVGRFSMNNELAMVWIATLALSPWACFLILAAWLVHGLHSQAQRFEG
ncbi:MAG: hypothetical protein ABJD97_01575 [Betaproteobacteria bacterium]